MDPYVGQTVGDVAARFGPPTSNFALIDSGRTAFQWDHFGAEQGFAPLPSGSGVRAALRECRLLVTTLPVLAGAPTTSLGNWIIQGWDAFGDCP